MADNITGFNFAGDKGYFAATPNAGGGETTKKKEKKAPLGGDSVKKETARQKRVARRKEKAAAYIKSGKDPSKMVSKKLKAEIESQQKAAAGGQPAAPAPTAEQQALGSAPTETTAQQNSLRGYRQSDALSYSRTPAETLARIREGRQALAIARGGANTHEAGALAVQNRKEEMGYSQQPTSTAQPGVTPTAAPAPAPAPAPAAQEAPKALSTADALALADKTLAVPFNYSNPNPSLPPGMAPPTPTMPAVGSANSVPKPAGIDDMIEVPGTGPEIGSGPSTDLLPAVRGTPTPSSPGGQVPAPGGVATANNNKPNATVVAKMKKRALPKAAPKNIA